jgi:hypothetical protein
MKPAKRIHYTNNNILLKYNSLTPRRAKGLGAGLPASILRFSVWLSRPEELAAYIASLLRRYCDRVDEGAFRVMARSGDCVVEASFRDAGPVKGLGSIGAIARGDGWGIVRVEVALSGDCGRAVKLLEVILFKGGG